MYLVDEDEVENIYNQVKDLEAYSFEGKVVIDPALDVGDKIIIDDKPIIYQGEADFQTRFIAEISSKISLKQKQETTVKTTSQKVLNRRVQSRIDETEGKITQLVEQNGEFENKLTQVEQSVDQIQQQVSDVVNYKRDLCGTTEIHLTDAGAQEILSLEIAGNKAYPTNLFPRRKCISKCRFTT